MNFIDVVILMLLLIAIWRGFKKGFILELFTFLALFLGLYAGINFSDYISEALRTKFGITSEYLPVISFAIIFLAIGAMVYFGGKALEKAIKVVQLSLVNKLMGIFFSVLKCVFILGGFIILIESYDERNDIVSDESKSSSVLYEPIRKVTLLSIPAFEESTVFLRNALHQKPKRNFDESVV